MDEKDRRYKIMNQTTMGWTLFADQAQNLTKEECDKFLDNALKAGANPQFIKVVAIMILSILMQKQDGLYDYNI